MKLPSWNIQHGGGTRAARIIDAIAALDPDVIALIEFREKPGEYLCAQLASRGSWAANESYRAALSSTEFR